MIVITALDTLKELQKEDYEILQLLNIDSPLGKMAVIKILQECTVLVAGPSSSKDLLEMMNQLSVYHLVHLFIDGAFSRKTSAALTDALLYVVGGSYSPILENVVLKAKNDVSIFRLEKAKEEFSYLYQWDYITIIDEDGNNRVLEERSVLDSKDFFKELGTNIRMIYLPLALTDSFAKEWINYHKKNKVKLIVKSPFSIQVSDEVFAQMEKAIQDIKVLKETNLIGVCMNPISVYGKNHSSVLMKSLLREALHQEIYNVKEDTI